MCSIDTININTFSITAPDFLVCPEFLGLSFLLASFKGVGTVPGTRKS